LRRGRWPIVDQVGGVDGADAGGEVPAEGSAVGRGERSVRSREHSHRATTEIAIGADATDIHVT